MISILLQSSGGGGIGGMLPLLLMIPVIYFFMIRPQMKKQKEQTKFIGAINKGDEVVTSSGIIGKINKIEENVVTLQVDSKTFIRVTKSAISREMTDAHQKSE